ncbi:GNAT family N-acetyltransferase [Thermofilum pendens]|uniref:N-acetyltransferase domain-containing protein n=1 Tax=Thermofilum pendens (strain DSM 2475 / Hrk 5) TaxID=368408 RepID=A1S150_THEPD|nr:GNAT family N-acetyltransferase [Thermofilum pendens]ABL79180.1 conserved hypothetical protein [Thermofilum pendens Hrk 5]
MEEVEVRPLEKAEEFSQAMEVQKTAWGMPDIEVIPSRILIAIARNGGLVLGAFARGRLVGYSFGFLARDSQGLYLYSHHTGVIPEYEDKGVGFALKAKQREYALRMGLSRVKWTFDPLQSRNSYFNLVKLGAVVREYHVNYYGELTDQLNRGLPSDRVVAEWYLESPRVVNRLGGRRPAAPGGAVPVIRVRGSEPVFEPAESTSVLVLVPLDIGGVKSRDPELALKWRLETRKAFQYYFSKGYIDHHYVRLDENYGAHVLSKVSLEEVLLDALPG